MVTTLVSAELEIEKAGAATVTVNVKLCEADPEAFVPVIVYVVADWVEVGVPLNCPVVVLKVKPVGAAGEIAYEAIAPPVEVLVTVVIALLTSTV